ncbi:MAG: bifunctional DNA primase/polymerase [Hyphomonadaceae bacterium]
MSRIAIAQAVCALLTCGLRPVPMIAAKKCPALKGWRARASLDPAQTAAHFAEAQHADAIGVATGEGVFVIDLDRNHGDGADGIASFAALVRKHGAVAPGPRVKSPAGGLHLYFACPAGRRVRSRAAIVAGVDVRGEDGLAMCPPSARNGVACRWAAAPWECALPRAPAWLLDMVAPIEAPPMAAASVRPYRGEASAYARVALERELKAVASAAPGVRNAALFKAAASLGSLCAGGALPADPVAASLVEAAAACGLVADDGTHAVEATIASGFKAGLARPRALPSQHGRRA